METGTKALGSKASFGKKTMDRKRVWRGSEQRVPIWHRFTHRDRLRAEFSDAPGRFSMMIGWPQRAESFSASMRGSTWQPVPGGSGTTIFMVRVGYAGCPKEAAGATKKVAVAIAMMRMRLV